LEENRITTVSQESTKEILFPGALALVDQVWLSFKAAYYKATGWQ